MMLYKVAKMACLVLLVAFVAAFPVMGWIRAQQSRVEHEYPSRIRQLAMRSSNPDPHADARARGKAVYQQYCRICHGDEGRGDGFNASRLDPPPRDFTDRAFWAATSEERVTYAISEGGRSVGKSVLMPRWRPTLSRQQVQDVIVFIRSLPDLAEPSAAP